LVFLATSAMIAGAQSLTGSSMQNGAPQVRPVLPNQWSEESMKQHQVSREEVGADEARREAQAQEEARLMREAQARGYWVDPSTGLMWPWKDSGKEMSWHAAMKYCRKLRVAGFTDWRLATIDELGGLIENTWSPVPIGEVRSYLLGGHAVREVFITGPGLWSSNPVMDSRGHPFHASYWYFDYQRGRRKEGFEDWAEGDHMPALCVRRPAG
jgi:hypothetical protein